MVLKGKLFVRLLKLSDNDKGIKYWKSGWMDGCHLRTFGSQNTGLPSSLKVPNEERPVQSKGKGETQDPQKVLFALN